MSDIVINNDHCALILSKEEAMIIYALVGKLPCSTVKGSGSIFSTIYDSGFISLDEYNTWWSSHVIVKCGTEGSISADDIIIMKKP